MTLASNRCSCTLEVILRWCYILTFSRQIHEISLSIRSFKCHVNVNVAWLLHQPDMWLIQAFLKCLDTLLNPSLTSVILDLPLHLTDPYLKRINFLLQSSRCIIEIVQFRNNSFLSTSSIMVDRSQYLRGFCLPLLVRLYLLLEFTDLLPCILLERFYLLQLVVCLSKCRFSFFFKYVNSVLQVLDR